MKIKSFENLRIEVIPVYRNSIRNDDLDDYDKDRLRHKVEEIEKQILRHCDVEENEVRIIRDSVFYCSHCKNKWEEDDAGLPLCCDKAAEEFEKSKIKHYSDCAVNNEPALPKGQCNCGGLT